MASIKDIGVNVRENGIALTLGLKTQILEDADVDALVKALIDMKPLVKKAAKERLKAEKATLQQQLEDINNQLDALKDV
jgi:hypothetical protein